jgi:hypothetical protein
MKFSELPLNKMTFRVKPTGSADGSLGEQPVFSAGPCLSRPGEFELALKDSVIFVKPTAEAETHKLGLELAGGRAMLAQLANPAVDGSIELQVVFCAGQCLEMGDVEIGVDEYIEQAYPKISGRRKRLSGTKLYESLATRCCYTHGRQSFFFVFAGPAIDRTLREEREDEPRRAPKENDEAEGPERTNVDAEDSGEASSSNCPEPTRKNSYCITGDGIRFVATETTRPDGKSVYIATRMTKFRSGTDRALRLAKGNLTFVDWTQAGQIQMITKAQMSALMRDDGSYLKKWDEFVEAEGELLLEQARRIDALQYTEMTPNRDGTVTVRISQASDSALEALALKNVDSLELADELPGYLENAELTFAQFTGIIEEEAEYEAFFMKRPGQEKEAKDHFEVADYDAAARLLTIKTENLFASGTLILSLAGQIAQIKRRLFARKAILEGCAANGQLGPLIEEKGVIAPVRPPTKPKSLTASVSEKVFPDNPPTDKQRKAIEVALNTPDIALIQGPPGTGKTTVIAAIIECLNEVADKSGKSIKGAVLLTGLQHDAVENMIDRLSLNGIPVPKFGKRSGAEEDDFNTFQRKLEEWCAEKATALRDKNPQLKEIERERQIKNLCLQYLRAPTRSLALILAEAIADLGILVLGEDCSRRAAKLATRLSEQEKPNAASDPLLSAVRRLRHRPESFADDGQARAADALEDLHDVLSEDERILIDKASLWHEEDGLPPFLSEIAELKRRMLASLCSPPVFRVEKQNDDVVALAEEAIDRIRNTGLSSQDARSAALAEFLSELESNPYGMVDAVSDYAHAFAATCQQSVNKQMQRQKGIKTVTSAEEFQKLEYEVVIVDEAARVAPPDLMVAMAQGKRIILVGDHRQLPHIVDGDVIERLAGDKDEDLLSAEIAIERDEENWSKISLFEHMFVNRLPMLKKQDGHDRCVTLDKQYRMHPLLGDFVSRNFYERFESSEKFGSGRPESDFAHSLPGTQGEPAIWLEVPAAKGRHQRRKGETSWTRSAEATAISKQLEKWITSAEGLCSAPELSENDFVDVFSIASQLKQKTRPIDEWLELQISDQTQALLSMLDAQSVSATALKKAFQEDFNQLLKKSPVYEISRFSGVPLRPEIKSLLPGSPQGESLVRLNRLLLEDAYPLELKRKPLSFGVISFYRAQADLIRKQVRKFVGNDTKLRIGTVDSFQGMEFDVVVLSMVRTLPEEHYLEKRKSIIEKKGMVWTDEIEAQISFGHLSLYNRLNVSMSRQKKVLIVAGDSGSLQGEIAAKYVPGLVDFYRLCCSDGKVLPCL